MKFILVKRDHEGGGTEVLVGASPITGNPYWSVLGAEPVVQPLLFRAASYAVEVANLAETKEAAHRPGEVGSWVYTTSEIEIDL